jgi:hypothetical protein
MNLGNDRHAAVVAAKLDILPEQTGANRRAAEIG